MRKTFTYSVILLSAIVGLSACGPQSDSASKAVIPEISSNDSSAFVTVEPKLLDSLSIPDVVVSTLVNPVKFGHGGNVGDHNISVFDSVSPSGTHFAVLRLIKNSHPNVATLKTVNLFENTAVFSMDKDSMLTLTVLSGADAHYVFNRSRFDFSNDYDLKITGYSPWTGGYPAIVGGEDPRAGYIDIKDFNGNILAINFRPNRFVRVSQPGGLSGGGLRFSTNYTRAYSRATNSPYCLTGVPRWAKDFSVVCQ